MNIHDLYKANSNFLKVEDLQGNRVVVQIESYAVETIKGKEGEPDKPQVVLMFVGKEKRLGLNKTNAERIATLANSPDPDTWIGAKIKLIPATTQFQGKNVPCIRVSEEFFEPPAVKAVSKAALASVPPYSGSQPADISDDDIPF